MASEKIFECFVFFLENLAFRLPWPPIKINELDKIHMLGGGLLQKHFSKILPQQRKHIGNNNKNTIHVEANVMNIYAKFQLHPPYGF